MLVRSGARSIAGMLARAVEFIDEKCGVRLADPPAIGLGHVSGELRMTPLEDIMRMADETLQRPREQWWMRLRPVARMMAHMSHPENDGAHST